MLKKLKLNNFQSHSDSTLEFSNGVNIIVGNSDSGKSSIIRAFEWIRTNKPKGDSFIKENEIMASVELITNNATIIRERTHTNTGTYKINNTEYSVMRNEVPEDIITLLNLSDINVQTQLDNHFLILDSPGNVAEYLNNITKLDILTKGVDKLKSLKNEHQKELNSLEQDKTDLENFLNSGIVEIVDKASKDYKYIVELLVKKNNLYQDINRISKICNDIKIVEEQKVSENKLKVLNDKIKQSTKLFNKLSILQGKIKPTEDLLYNILDTIVRQKAISKQLDDTKIRVMEVKTKLKYCPYCGHLLNIESKKKLLGV